jgi:hypothetical protein
VRVPDEASNGTAKVTLSFPDWKTGKVAPAYFEIPVIDPEPKKQAPIQQAVKKTGQK